jgi:DNA repair protein RadC
LSQPPTEQPSSPEYNPRIREIPASERPRERLRDHGAGALNNAELLAIILRNGSARQSVLRLAEGLLAKHGGLGGLARRSFADLTREKGIGEAKASEILAAFQLALRLNALQPEERAYVRSPADVNNLLGAEMALLDQEHLRVLLINTRNQLMGITEVTRATLARRSSAPPRCSAKPSARTLLDHRGAQPPVRRPARLPTTRR